MYLELVQEGGPGSGCRGPTCGRKKGAGADEEPRGRVRKERPELTKKQIRDAAKSTDWPDAKGASFPNDIKSAWITGGEISFRKLGEELGNGLKQIEVKDPKTRASMYFPPDMSNHMIGILAERVEQYAPKNSRSIVRIHNTDAPTESQVGGRSFRAAAEYLGGGIDFYRGGYDDAIMAHEFAHMTYDHNESRPEISKQFDSFKKELDKLSKGKTKVGITDYNDEYFTAGDESKYTEAFAAIAQNDADISGEQNWRQRWSDESDSVADVKRRLRILKAYDSIMSYSKGTQETVSDLEPLDSEYSYREIKEALITGDISNILNRYTFLKDVEGIPDPEAKRAIMAEFGYNLDVDQNDWNPPPDVGAGVLPDLTLKIFDTGYPPIPPLPVIANTSPFDNDGFNHRNPDPPVVTQEMVWVEGDHPRDEDGKFTSGGITGKLPEKVEWLRDEFKDIWPKIEKQKGCSAESTGEMVCGAASVQMMMAAGSHADFGDVEGGIYAGAGAEESDGYNPSQKGVSHMWYKTQDGTILDAAAGQFHKDKKNLTIDDRLVVIPPDDPRQKWYKRRYVHKPFANKGKGKQVYDKPTKETERFPFEGYAGGRDVVNLSQYKTNAPQNSVIKSEPYPYEDQSKKNYVDAPFEPPSQPSMHNEYGFNVKKKIPEWSYDIEDDQGGVKEAEEDYEPIWAKYHLADTHPHMDVCNDFKGKVYDLTEMNRPVPPSEGLGYTTTHPNCKCWWEPIKKPSKTTKATKSQQKEFDQIERHITRKAKKGKLHTVRPDGSLSGRTRKSNPLRETIEEIRKDFDWLTDEYLDRIQSIGAPGEMFLIRASNEAITDHRSEGEPYRRWLSPDELHGMARTAIGKGMDVNHHPEFTTNAQVLDSEYNKDRKEIQMIINEQDPQILDAIDKGIISAVSINGGAPRNEKIECPDCQSSVNCECFIVPEGVVLGEQDNIALTWVVTDPQGMRFHGMPVPPATPGVKTTAIEPLKLSKNGLLDN